MPRLWTWRLLFLFCFYLISGSPTSCPPRKWAQGVLCGALTFLQAGRPSVLQEHCWLCLDRENGLFSSCSVTQWVCDKVQIKALTASEGLGWPCSQDGQSLPEVRTGPGLCQATTRDSFQSCPFVLLMEKWIPQLCWQTVLPFEGLRW